EIESTFSFGVFGNIIPVTILARKARKWMRTRSIYCYLGKYTKMKRKKTLELRNLRKYLCAHRISWEVIPKLPKQEIGYCCLTACPCNERIHHISHVICGNLLM